MWAAESACVYTSVNAGCFLCMYCKTPRAWPTLQPSRMSGAPYECAGGGSAIHDGRDCPICLHVVST